MSYSENFHTYLRRKVVTVLNSLENEVDDMRKTLFGLENNAKGEMTVEYLEELVVKVESLFKRARINVHAFKRSDVSGEEGLDSYRKILKMLWATDLEITEMRARVLEDSKKVDPEANMILESKEVKDQIITTRPFMTRRRQDTQTNSASTCPLICSKIPTKAVPFVDKNVKNIVSIVIRTSRKETKPKRQLLLRQKLKMIDDLVSIFKVLFRHTSSPESCMFMVLGIGFLNLEDAREFFVKLKPLLQMQTSCWLLSKLMSEAELGYQHEPVLNEGDLLCIQDPYHCKNIFTTDINIKVEQTGDTVIYKFESVMDVNRFLFNKSASASTRHLGELRMNVVPKRLVPDDNGFYRLVSTDVARLERLKGSQKFTTSQAERGGKVVPGMAFLLFLTRLDLFEFLLSKVASQLDHLQFDDSSIEFDNLK